MPTRPARVGCRARAASLRRGEDGGIGEVVQRDRCSNCVQCGVGVRRRIRAGHRSRLGNGERNVAEGSKPAGQSGGREPVHPFGCLNERWRARRPASYSSLPTQYGFRQNPVVNFREKIVPWDELAAWRAALRSRGQTLVVTNGCFDLLHPGHVTYLEAARNLGEALLVGLNSDESVRQLKGNDRPVNSESDRAIVLAALASVDGVCLFREKSATRFLAAAQPDIYVKGGDYTVETMNPEERRLVELGGGKVVVLPVVPGKSTTALLQKIAQL